MRRTWWTTAATLASVALGVVLVVAAYAMASRHGASQSHYHVFWLGMTFIFTPLVLVLSAKETGRLARLLASVALGLATYLPRFVRLHTAPLVNDEFGHFQQSEALFRTGRLFAKNSIVPPAQDFPGLHTLTVGLRELSGISTITLGAVLVAAFHVLAVVGIYCLASSLADDRRVGGLAASLYAVSPSFGFFDSMYAYESFAIPLLIWSIVCATHLIEARRRADRRYWVVALVIVAGAAVTTHHLTSYVLIFSLIVLTLTHRLGRSAWVVSTARSGRMLGFVALVLVALAGWRIVNSETDLVSYLSVFPRRGAAALVEIFRSRTDSGSSPTGSSAPAQPVRELFQGSALPGYEQYLAYLISPVLLLLAGIGAWTQRRLLNARTVALCVLGLAYFASLPFVLTSGGSPGAHRSWAYSYVGLSVVAGLGLSRLAESLPRLLNRMLCPLVIVAVLMGNYGSAVPDAERFPGPYQLGRDGRSVTPELIEMAKWFGAHEGRGKPIVTDLRTAAPMVAYAEVVLPRFPSWELFFPTVAPRSQFVDLLYERGIRYVVVNRRLATDHYYSVPYFHDQPAPPSNPLPLASIDKFDELPWLTLIYESPNFRIYRTVDREIGLGE